MGCLYEEENTGFGKRAQDVSKQALSRTSLEQTSSPDVSQGRSSKNPSDRDVSDDANGRCTICQVHILTCDSMVKYNGMFRVCGRRTGQVLRNGNCYRYNQPQGCPVERATVIGRPLGVVGMYCPWHREVKEEEQRELAQLVRERRRGRGSG